MKVIGIIGAGVSGLCVAHRAASLPNMQPIVWEQSEDLGGTWRLSEEVDMDMNGLPVHSSMYQNLRCDLPRIVMALPNHPFPEEGEDFAHHAKVLLYLENYAEKHELRPLIKFGHHVEKVSPILKEDGQPPAWEVIVKSLKDERVTTTVVDALCICNGHFSTPIIPEIPNIANFKGEKLHSHHYREPTPFSGLKVLVLGAGASGLDISLEVSSVAEKVYLSHNFPVIIPSELPPNIRQVPCVESALGNGFILNNGETVIVDAILYCTGYNYNFPFLSESCGIYVENKVVKPIYKHIINVNHPSMGFIGIPSRVIVFPLVYYQACYFLATVIGDAKLPSKADMMTSVQKSFENLRLRGRKEKEYHLLHLDQFDYMEDLASCAGLEPPLAFKKQILKIVIARLFLSFPLFKTYSYAVSEDGTVVESRNGVIIRTGWDLTMLSFKQLVRLLWRDFYRVSWVIGSFILRSVAKFFIKD